MARCPKCDSNEVYRHAGFRKGRYYICRDCMSDLVEVSPGFFSARTLAVVAVASIEVLLMLAFSWPPVLLIVAGFIALIPATRIADLLISDLEAVPRVRSPIAGNSKFARGVWEGLRRRNEPPTT